MLPASAPDPRHHNEPARAEGQAGDLPPQPPSRSSTEVEIRRDISLHVRRESEAVDLHDARFFFVGRFRFGNACMRGIR